MRRTLLAIVAVEFVLVTLAMLPGCQPQHAAIRPAPAVVSVPDTRYVPVPDSATAHAPATKVEELPADLQPQDLSSGEGKRVAKARGEALIGCYRQLDDVRAIQGTQVPSPKKPPC